MFNSLHSLIFTQTTQLFVVSLQINEWDKEFSTYRKPSLKLRDHLLQLETESHPAIRKHYVY